ALGEGLGGRARIVRALLRLGQEVIVGARNHAARAAGGDVGAARGEGGGVALLAATVGRVEGVAGLVAEQVGSAVRQRPLVLGRVFAPAAVVPGGGDQLPLRAPL